MSIFRSLTLLCRDWCWWVVDYLAMKSCVDQFLERLENQRRYRLRNLKSVYIFNVNQCCFDQTPSLANLCPRNSWFEHQWIGANICTCMLHFLAFDIVLRRTSATVKRNVHNSTLIEDEHGWHSCPMSYHHRLHRKRRIEGKTKIKSINIKFEFVLRYSNSDEIN